MAMIEARAIMEIMGRPPEHIAESLNTLVVKMGAEKGVKIANKKYHDPVPVKEVNNLYTAFAELELELDGITTLLMITYIYSPSNIEVVSPETLKLSNDDINEFFNNLLARIHHYGALLKRSNTERDIFLSQLQYLKKKLGTKVDKTLQDMVKDLQKGAKKPSKPTKKNSKK